MANLAQRSASPSKFESHGTSSPSKLGVPNRKQRNQPSNRVHDIEFVTEISTSLIAQLRHVQTQLAERDDQLRNLTLEKSRLEIEAEGFNQRLRSLDESEHRYKDENWNLETQIHEFLAAAKEAADREKRLTQNLNSLQADKSAAQKELDDIKLSHAKLSEDHAATLKHHDAELGTVKRSMTMAETERSTLQRKVEELAGQNQELAKAVAHQRGRLEDRDQGRGFSDEDFETAADNATPEHSPPPSPVKGTPRHSMLESETLKSSLHHAQRMMQSLRSNIHREKAEKLELRRMLQDARDELDARRNDMGSGNGKKNRKVDSREFKKPLKPGQLGGLRNSRSEVSILDDPNWEEDDGQASPSHTAVTAARVAAGVVAGGVIAKSATSSDHFETAPENDTTDAFETANEGATETEDFQTGVEDISGSDELTETEGGTPGKRQRPTPLSLTKVGNRQSYQSTASTSGDEYAYDEVKTPTAQQPQRLRLKVSRGGNRRSRAVSEEPQFQSSPASFANSSRGGTPQVGQSLFAELGDMSDEDDSMQGTPSRFRSRSNTPSRPSTAKGMPAPDQFIPPVPKLPMVDSGMMTEAWEPQPATPLTAVPLLAGAGLAGAALTEAAHVMHDEPTKPALVRQMSDMHTSTDPEPQYSSTDKHTSTDTEQSMERLMQDMHTSTDPEPKVQMSDAAIQWHEDQLNNLLKVDAGEGSRPISASTLSDASSQYDAVIMDEKLKKFPSPPSSRAHTPMASLAGLEAMSNPLAMSNIVSEHFEPSAPESPIIPQISPEAEIPTPKPTLLPASLAFSSIQSVDTEPISPRSPRRDAVIIPRDESDSDDGVVVNSEQPGPTTPKATFLGSVFGWNKGKSPATPIIAEDDTRQSPSDSPMVETPESQRPFKEMSSNPHERSVKKPQVETVDESSQTALTAEQIDEMLSSKRKDGIVAQDSQKVASPPRGIMTNLKARQSQESIGSVGRARSKMPEPDYIHDTVTPVKRPGSAGSRNNSMSSTHPPLPTDHKQVIAAAAQRTGSSGGGTGSVVGSMGPPLMPASAYKTNPSFRPRTPSSQPPLSPSSVRGGTTPRPMHSSGTAEIQSPTRTGRSRTSSVSSFVSEIDTRFNMRSGMPHGIDPSTDPRMINAITQTMIGEYLWKYTRKAGRGTMSDNRHRRYFWVHPYTRTLYWSDRDPSSAGRAELKAKSVPIEAVRVVTDDNPMPPGLHRKSLVIMTPGRSVKFTATTGQRHETWFNALSYLLLRTGEDAVADTDQIANAALTSEDVAEFNPGYGGTGTARPGPPSLSSYNSRTTRNESPMRKTTRMSMQPQLTSTSSRPTAGTFSRLSSYWKPGKEGSAGIGSFSSRRSRHSISGTGSIYEASEVHDSAEDLRQIIEQQDRESDRLENVRACCDGK